MRKRRRKKRKKRKMKKKRRRRNLLMRDMNISQADQIGGILSKMSRWWQNQVCCVCVCMCLQYLPHPSISLSRFRCGKWRFPRSSEVGGIRGKED